jgi:hypothetical protein
MLILQTAFLSIVSGGVVYLAVKLYVVILSAIVKKSWPVLIGQIASTFVYLALIPIVISPLMLLFYVPGGSGLMYVAWVFFLYIACLFPSLMYWHRYGKGL